MTWELFRCNQNSREYDHVAKVHYVLVDHQDDLRKNHSKYHLYTNLLCNSTAETS